MDALKAGKITSDFIEPSQACIKKPVQFETGKKNRVLQLEDQAEAAVPKVAKITLNDCLACAGCITSAETVLIKQQSIEEFERMLGAASTSYDLVVVSLSAPARAAIAVHCGLGLREVQGRLSGFLKGIGCHHVVDCSVAAEVGLLQSAAEFLHRVRSHNTTSPAAHPAAGPAAAARSSSSATDAALPLPLFTSSCPGWVCYAEKMVGDAILPFLSKVKSPQQIQGTLLKYGHAAAAGLRPERVCHVSVMPCFDKKLEASRDDFFNPDAGPNGSRDVDCVLSSAELLTLLEQRGCAMIDGAMVDGAMIDGAMIDGCAPATEPDSEPSLSRFVGSVGSGGGDLTYASPGASGGTAEFVFRCAAKELYGVDMPPGPLPWTRGKNSDLHELELSHGGQVVLKFCRAFGFRNIQNIVRRAKSGRCPYQLVELMACPAGCANGGGQPKPPKLEAPVRAAAVEARLIDPSESTQRGPLERPCLQALYAPGGFLAGGPYGEACQRHLLTSFHAVDASAQDPLAVQW